MNTTSVSLLERLRQPGAAEAWGRFVHLYTPLLYYWARGAGPYAVNPRLHHKSADFTSQLKAAAPKGIDIYFENVGGAVFDAVMPLLNTGARVPLCGLVSQYNATSLPGGPDRLPWLMGQILRKRLTVRGFIIFQDFGPLYPQFAKTMHNWLSAGKMQYREEMIEGLEQAPQAFIGLLRGENFGKRVIHLGPAKAMENNEIPN